MARSRLTNPIVGTAGKIFIYGVYLDLVPVTTADSTAWTITNQAGDLESQGTLTYIASMPVRGYEEFDGWYANVTWPSAPGAYHVHFTIVKSSAPMKWHEFVRVDAFTP